ncbi:MAG TPA: hypothetical protein VI542_14990 [Candidatus Tectomicrobia bacterium]
MLIATHADERHIEAGHLALGRGVRDTAVRRFRCDVTIGPKAEN